jgi:hypothetical protein
MGLTATIIEAPEDLQASVTIPAQHLDACKAQNIPTEGNAAGNKGNWTDLFGANTSPPNPDNGLVTPFWFVRLHFPGADHVPVHFIPHQAPSTGAVQGLPCACVGREKKCEILQ